MELWQEKAHTLIYRLCQTSYLQANYRNGRKLKSHVPYSVPALAEELIDCLNRNDEVAAKAIFHTYAGQKVVDGIICY